MAVVSAPGYTPIADDSGAVIEARPEYYGLLLFALAGSGTLLETQLSAGSVDVTAYAVRTASGGLNLIVVNKDALQNLTLTIQTNQPIQTASMQIMTGPSLAAISGVTIQGATMNQDGTFAPASPENADSLCGPNNLLPPGAQRRAYQHHLSMSLEPLHGKEQGVEKNCEIEKDAAILDVIKVILNGFMDDKPAITAELPEAGQDPEERKSLRRSSGV